MKKAIIIIFVAILITSCATTKTINYEVSEYQRLAEKEQNNPYPDFLDWSKKK